MSKLRVTAIALLIACCIPTMLFAGKNDEQIKALEERVADLEAKIDAQHAEMKKLLETHFGKMEKTIAESAQSGEQRERQAQVLLGQVNQAVRAGKFDEAKTKLANLKKKYGSTNTARRAANVERELNVIGKSMPEDLGIEKWFQGESEFDASSSEPTLLVFWETWCPHCKREVPKLQTMWDKYKDQGLQVVGLTKLTRSSTEEVVSKFIEDTKMTYPVAKEDGKASSYFGVAGIPAAAVVKDGKVIWRGHPANISDAMLQDWM